jgi:hypothetical protein
MLVYRMPPLTQLAYIIPRRIASRKLAAGNSSVDYCVVTLAKRWSRRQAVLPRSGEHSYGHAFARDCMIGRISETLLTNRTAQSLAEYGCGLQN